MNSGHVNFKCLVMSETGKMLQKCALKHKDNFKTVYLNKRDDMVILEL